MTFLHASLAAAGLACIAVPIIIHLLMHRRRKPVMWGAMRFLLEAYRRQRRRLMLEKWLLLACRCLVLALLAMAIGRPLIGRLGAGGGGRTLYLLIDNGLTSGLRSDADEGRTALDRHKADAKAALAALREARGPGGGAGGAAIGEGDRVGLIALGGPAEGLVVPSSADLASIAGLIDAIEPADSRADLAGALQLVASAMSRGDGTDAEAAEPPVSDPDRTYVAVFSDFREGSLELGPAGAGAEGTAPGTGGTTLAGVRLPEGVTLMASRPAAAGAGANVSIIGVEPLRSIMIGEGSGGAAGADASNPVRVQLRRSGGDLPAAETTVQVRLISPEAGAGAAADDAVNRATVRWGAGVESATAIVPVPRGASGTSGPRGASSGLILASIDGDPLRGDNTWRRPVEFREALRVGVVGPTRFSDASADQLDPASWVRLALSPTGDSGIGGVEVVDIDPASVDAARLAGLDALVLPRPDLVQNSSWVRIGLFMSSGGVVVVAPPPDLSVHLWADAMVKGLGLPAGWALPRESRVFEGAKLAIPPAPAPAPSSPEGAAAGGAPTEPDLLAVVRTELDELVRPVVVRRALPLENTGEGGRVLMTLEDDSPVLWAGRPVTPGGGTVGRAGTGLLVYLGLAFSLDWTDLPARPLMVPLVQETIRQGVGQARGSWSSIAGTRPSAPARTVELRQLAEPERPGAAGTATERTGELAVVSIDETGIAGQPLRHAASFAAIDDRGGQRALLAINPDPRGGRTRPQSQPAVGAYLSGAVASATTGEEGSDAVAAVVVWLPSGAAAALPAGGAGAESVQGAVAGLFGEGERGSPIDLPLLIAALLLAIVEVALARWASHADVIAPGAARLGTLGTGRAAA